MTEQTTPTTSSAGSDAWLPGFAMSPTIGKIAKALAAAQGEMTDPVKDATNPHYGKQYTTLVAVTSAYRPVLSKHGLSLTQWHLGDRLVSMLMHESGEWMRGVGPINPVKNDPQGIASATTYARRYASMAIVGIAPADDDDGNAASVGGAHPAAKPAAKKLPKPPANADVNQAKKELLGLLAAARKGGNSSLSDTAIIKFVIKDVLGKATADTLEDVARVRAAILVNKDYDLDTAERIPGDAKV